MTIIPAPRDALTHGPLSSLDRQIMQGLLVHARTVSLEAKAALFRTGDPGQGCYVVQSGALKATVVAASGREHMFAVFGPGDIVGEMSLFDDEQRSATVEAIRKSTLLYVSADTFFLHADKNPGLYRIVLSIMAKRLRGTNEDVMVQGSSSVMSRVARALLALANSLGEQDPDGSTRITEKVSQMDIASMAGVARENASRTINHWLRSKVLGRRDGYYFIRNRGVLDAQMNI